MEQLFTLGYEKRSIGEFIDLLLAQRIDVLVDVRETAWSHKPGFSKGALADALRAAGIDYVHARFAGNPKSLRATARDHRDCLARYEAYLEDKPEVLVEFSELIGDRISKGQRVCLTCFERHPDDCHRGILAGLWKRARRARVEHIAPDGCRRLVTAQI